MQKNLKTIQDFQQHHNFFIKGVLLWQQVHMNVYACETKIGITPSGDNLNGHPFSQRQIGTI